MRRLTHNQRDLAVRAGGQLLGMVDCLISYSRESAEHRTKSDQVPYHETMPEDPTDEDALRFLRLVCDQSIKRIDKRLGTKPCPTT